MCVRARVYLCKGGMLQKYTPCCRQGGVTDCSCCYTCFSSPTLSSVNVMNQMEVLEMEDSLQ